MNKKEILELYYGYDSLKPEQEEIIDSIMKGIDTIGILPTGYGKTITFSIPALILEGITLVICPLISLMIDQVNNLKEKGIKAEYINSLLDNYEKEIIYNKIKKGKIKLLYLAAERLGTIRLNTIFKDIKISLIVCDEAHTLLWSEDFRKDILNIKTFLNSLDYHPTILALTATATDETKLKIMDILNLKNPKIISLECDRSNIFYRVINSKNKDRDLLNLIKNKNEKIIIYTLTINDCIHVYNLLKKEKYLVDFFHGKMDKNDKEKTLIKFKKGISNIVVSTNAFGMGIDISDIRLIIEYSIPSSLEDFSQQIGRASRDGLYAEGIILFNIKDIKSNEYFIENINIDDYKTYLKIKRDRYKKLDKVIEFCTTKKCLHKGILNYFGFESENCKTMCSNCIEKYNFYK